MNSKWLDWSGTGNVADIIRQYNVDISYTTVMGHMKRHLKPMFDAQKEKAAIKEFIGNEKLVTQNQLKEVVTGEVISEKANHEAALDNFIDKFQTMVRNDEIQITATTGLQAIKIKAEIQKGNKDRKLDALKLMMGTNANSPADKTATSN